jgi:molecular chaperone DnaK
MIFEIDKQLKDLGDKVTESEKSAVESAKADLQAAIDANDVEGMKTKMEALTNAFYPISTRIYQEAQAQAQGAQGAQGAGFNPNMGGGFNPGNMGGAGFGGQSSSNNNNNDGTVDADYTVVEED